MQDFYFQRLYCAVWRVYTAPYKSLDRQKDWTLGHSHQRAHCKGEVISIYVCVCV